MANWPTTIPTCQANYSEVRMDGTLRSQMETGPAKTRRRFTATPVFLSLNYLLNAAQVETLDDFYANITLQGSERFGFTHPRRQVPVQARFMGPPEFSASDGGLLYRAAVNLEILP